MLTIRPEQFEMLSQEARSSFEQRMLQHLNESFPEECGRAGDERVRGAISQGIVRAAKYGIVSEIDVARYIDLSVALGLDFDSGKRQEWVPEILQNASFSASAKLALIFDRVKSAWAQR